MAVVVIGNTGYTLVRETPEYRQGQGWTLRAVYEGPEAGFETQIATLLAEDPPPIGISTQRNAPVCTIVATFAKTPTGVTWDGDVEAEAEAEWRLIPYDLPKSLGTHGAFNESAQSIEVIPKIDAAIRAGNSDETDWETEYADGSLYDSYDALASIGVKQWQTFGFTLRKSLAVGDDGNVSELIQFDQDNAGKVVTWAQATQSLPAGSGIEQPWVHIYIGAGQSLGALNFKDDNGGTGVGWCDVYFDQWMVKPPRLGYRRVGRVRKRLIEQEWLGAVFFSKTLYDGGLGTPGDAP